MEPYIFTEDDAELRIDPSIDIPGAAVIAADGGVRVQAHELAAVVAALYEAAGQPVPDLPVIHDQAEVNRLAELIHYAAQGTIGYGSADFNIARVLLAHGVRLPEATP